MNVSDITNSLPANNAGAGSSATTTAALGSDDFLKLLITQLTNQDPLAPTDNDALLQQLSSIREIELSSTLTDSLQSLTGQQRLASASTLIGQYVTGTPGEDGVAQQGLVVGVRFTESGQAMLQLSNGSELPLDGVNTIKAPLPAAQSLVGLQVVGVDRRDPADPKPIDGVVTSAQAGPSGETILELDTGDSVRLRDVLRTSAPAAA